MVAFGLKKVLSLFQRGQPSTGVVEAHKDQTDYVMAVTRYGNAMQWADDEIARTGHSLLFGVPIGRAGAAAWARLDAGIGCELDVRELHLWAVKTVMQGRRHSDFVGFVEDWIDRHPAKA